MISRRPVLKRPTAEARDANALDTSTGLMSGLNRLPPRLSRMTWGTAALIVFQTPVELMSLTSCQRVSSICNVGTAGLWPVTPALAGTAEQGSAVGGSGTQALIIWSIDLASEAAPLFSLDQPGRLGKVFLGGRVVGNCRDAFAHIRCDGVDTVLGEPDAVAMPWRAPR